MPSILLGPGDTVVSKILSCPSGSQSPGERRGHTPQRQGDDSRDRGAQRTDCWSRSKHPAQGGQRRAFRKKWAMASGMRNSGQGKAGECPDRNICIKGQTGERHHRRAERESIGKNPHYPNVPSYVILEIQQVFDSCDRPGTVLIAESILNKISATLALHFQWYMVKSLGLIPWFQHAT